MTNDALTLELAKQMGAHPYPIRIAGEANDSLNASFLNNGILEIARNQYLRYPWALWMIRREFTISNRSWHHGLGAIFTRSYIYGDTTLKNAVITFISIWDWYIRRIGRFVIFARSQNTEVPLEDRHKKDLLRIGKFPSIKDQIRIIQNNANVPIEFSDSADLLFQEMICVRNLGIHNQWEIDEEYKKKSPQGDDWNLGDLRRITIDEVEQWEVELLKLVNNVAVMLSARYGQVPDYSYP